MACPSKSEAGPAAFWIAAASLGTTPALRLTLYAVGWSQVTETADIAFFIAAASALYPMAEEEAWQVA
jgi:hypothetical protein